MAEILPLKPLFADVPSLNIHTRYHRIFRPKSDDRVIDHVHDYYEIYVHFSGAVSFLVNNSIHPIERGSIVIIKPYEIHRCINIEDCEHEYFCLWIKNDLYAHPEIRELIEKNTVINLPADKREELLEMCVKLHKACTEGTTSPFEGMHAFYHIMDTVSQAEVASLDQSHLPIRLTHVMAFIAEHFSEKRCTVREISKECDISRSTMCRYFRTYLKTTPNDYIESKRLANAQKMLVEGIAVRTACEKSGFVDQSYFTKRFKERFDTTPSKFQKDYAAMNAELRGKTKSKRRGRRAKSENV